MNWVQRSPKECRRHPDQAVVWVIRQDRKQATEISTEEEALSR